MGTDTGFNTTEYLVDRFLDEIIRLAFVYTRSREDAQDAAQQVFLTYLQRRPVFESEEHAKRWLLKVAVNVAKNMRRSKEARSVSFDAIEGCIADVGAAERTEEQEAVLAAVMKLKQSYREIIHLYYYEDMDTAQIARFLGMTEGGVRAKLARARLALEKELKGGDTYAG